MTHWEWLTILKVNSWSLTRDDHALCYRSAAEVIDEGLQHEFDYVDEAEKQRMKDANVIYHFQVFPDTPVGSYSWYASTAAGVIEAAMKSLVLDKYIQPSPFVAT